MMFLLALGIGLMTWYYFGIDTAGSKFGFGRIGGVILLLLCAAYSYILCRKSGNENSEEENDAPDISRAKASCLIVLALVMITAGAKLMVDTVVWSAAKMGVDPLMISLTVVAIGTSLPELAVTISGVLKKREDIALGNIIGSGIYNIVLIIGCCSVVSPLAGDGKSSFEAMIIMNITALLLLVFMLPAKKLYRWQGFIFLALYAAFAVWSYCCVK